MSSQFILTDVPLETIQHHIILPYLKLNDIVSFISSSRYFRENFTCQCRALSSEEHSFADQFWKTLCMKRWKSIFTFGDLPVTLKARKEHSQWYLQYMRKHKIDANAKHQIDRLFLLEKEKHLLQRSKSVKDFVEKEITLLRADIMKNLDVWDFMIESTQKIMHRELGQQDVEETDMEQHQSIEQSTVIALLESMHKFRICQKFQHLIMYEQKLLCQDNEVEGQLLEGTSEDIEVKHKYSLEYGAVLIARYYQNAKEIISDYNICHGIDIQSTMVSTIHDDEKSLTLDQFVEIQIEGLTDFIRQKLIERKQREHEFGNELFFASGEPWPMHWILEEMKILFRNDIEDDISIVNELSPSQKFTKIIDERPLRGNTKDYYSIDNSLIDKVIQSRKGIPLTLSILYQAIVRRLTNSQIEPVGFPGHFMLSTEITIPSHQPERVFVDVFHSGNIMTKKECQDLICSRYDLEWDESFTNPITKSSVWFRMVRNLFNCYIVRTNETYGIQGSVENEYDLKMMDSIRVLYREITTVLEKIKRL